MKTYSNYKYSGIDWISEIPEPWYMWKIKFVSYYQNGAAFSSELFRNDGDVYVIRIGDLVGSRVLLEKATTVTKEVVKDYQNVKLKKDDILLALTGATIGKSALFNLNSDCYLNQRVALFRPRKNILKEYLMLFIDSELFKTHIDFECYGGAQENVGKSQILNVILPLPELTEQQKIAAFLDYKTALIDKFIANRKRQIELLEEKKAAIINKAVTKGINPDVKLKPSGVEWIGDIPEHWEIRTIGNIKKKLANGFVGPTRDILKSEGVRYLQSLHIKDNKIVFNPPYFVNKEWSELHPRSILKQGDVLIVQTGDIGQVACVSNEFENCNCHALIIWQIQKKFGYGVYFSLLLYSNYGFNSLKSIQTGALHPHLNSTQIKYIKIPVPPNFEQLKILNYLSSETSKIGLLISKYQKQIELIEEYKTALISKAVTGKIDVRDWQTPE